MNRMISLFSVAIALAFTASANAQNNAQHNINDGLFNYQVYTASNGALGRIGHFVVVYRAAGLPEYVGPFGSSTAANDWAIRQFNYGLTEDWRDYEVVYTIRGTTDWQYRGTYNTRAAANAAIAVFEAMGYNRTRVERVSALQQQSGVYSQFLFMFSQ